MANKFCPMVKAYADGTGDACLYWPIDPNNPNGHEGDHVFPRRICPVVWAPSEHAPEPGPQRCPLPFMHSAAHRPLTDDVEICGGCHGYGHEARRATIVSLVAGAKPGMVACVVCAGAGVVPRAPFLGEGA